MKYINKTKVAYYDCDEKASMRMSAALQCMQQAGGDHLNEIGLGYEKLYNENMVFLLSKTIAKVHHRMPMADENINVTTTPGHHIGARFTREAIISDENFTPLVSILTQWVLVDPETRRIMRPSDFPYELPIQDSILGDEVKDEKFPRLKDIEPYNIVKQPVVYSIVDNNKHVNNSAYVDIVCDLMPYDELVNSGIDKMMIAYQNEARYGDEIGISCYESQGKRYNFVGTKKSGNCFEAQIILRD